MRQSLYSVSSLHFRCVYVTENPGAEGAGPELQEGEGTWRKKEVTAKQMRIGINLKNQTE